MDADAPALQANYFRHADDILGTHNHLTGGFRGPECERDSLGSSRADGRRRFDRGGADGGVGSGSARCKCEARHDAQGRYCLLWLGAVGVAAGETKRTNGRRTWNNHRTTQALTVVNNTVSRPRLLLCRRYKDSSCALRFSSVRGL